jgi:hypothetical protein
MFKSEKSGAHGLTLRPQDAGVRARELERCFPGLGAAVAQENTVKARDISQPHRQFRGVLMEEEIGCVQKLPALLGKGIADRRMVVAQRTDADTAEKVEVIVAILVAKVHTLT